MSPSFTAQPRNLQGNMVMCQIYTKSLVIPTLREDVKEELVFVMFGRAGGGGRTGTEAFLGIIFY